MKKEFVTYEQALALKELGFQENCFGRYTGGELIVNEFMIIGSNQLIKYPKDSSTAPLIQQAFRFFREKYGLYEYIILDEDNEFYFTIYENGSEVIAGYIFFIYEEAEQACLNRLIEIAKDSKQ